MRKYPHQPLTPKWEQAVLLRDISIVLVQKYGIFEKSNIGNMLTWSSDKFIISYRTPFNKIPPVPDEVSYQAAILGESALNLPYGINVWTKPKGKVLNLEWNDEGKIFFISFKRGEWEQDLKFLDPSES